MLELCPQTLLQGGGTLQFYELEFTEILSAITLSKDEKFSQESISLQCPTSVICITLRNNLFSREIKQ